MATTTKKKTESTEPASYREAMEELETIVEEVDDRNVDIDVLSAKVKRAHELIAFCQARVDAVRFEVENIMSSTEQEEPF
ncbi:MAG TPA: exodeoxyribonuclease VII small subunit [Acidimicrobiia bacterium]|nr:exodeoxyribonuclease VII small subunit [Acidimicrobiia bacterium]